MAALLMQWSTSCPYYDKVQALHIYISIRWISVRTWEAGDCSFHFRGQDAAFCNTNSVYVTPSVGIESCETKQSQYLHQPATRA